MAAPTSTPNSGGGLKSKLWPTELARGGDPENVQLLAGDREGFQATLKNQNVKHIFEEGELPVLDSMTYSDFDVCFVFPREVKKGDTEMTAEQVHTELFTILRARVGKSVDELNHVEKLHPVYGLGKSYDKPMTKQQFADLVRDIFFRVLEHIGALFVIEEGQDKKKSTFVRVRLHERGCQVIADYKKYPLQVSREATRYKEFRSDPEFVPPYMGYERLIEEGPLAEAEGRTRIWQRYDRLSRPLKHSHVEPGEASIFRDVDRIRLLRMALFEFINFDYMAKKKWLQAQYALKQPCIENALKTNWAHAKKLHTSHQPLDQIRNYFGEEVALYYAWLGYYTKLLVAPAVVGLVVGIIGFVWNKDLSFDHPWVNASRLFFCVFVGVWCSFFFCLWRRKEKVLELAWGVEEAETAGVSDEENPFFKSDKYIADPVQPDKFIRYFSPVKRRIRLAITSFFVFVSCICVIILVNDDISDALGKASGRAGEEEYFGLEGWVRYMSPSDKMAEHASHVVLATTMLIKVYDFIWKALIAKRLVAFENHQQMQKHDNSLNLKFFFFKFAGYFVTLFYLAFFKEFYNPCDDTEDGRCLPRLSKQLTNFFIVDFAMNAVEIIKPFVTYTVKKMMAKPEAQMPFYQYQAYLTSYNSKGLRGDYMEKVMEFGYIALFSMAVPILPTLALIVNLFELRTDGYKLVVVHQRPFPRQADGVGIWDDLQKALTFLGILSNALLCAFATIGHDSALATKLTTALVILLIALAIKDSIEYKLPPESPKYKLMKARMQVVDYEAMWGPQKLQQQLQQKQQSSV